MENPKLTPEEEKQFADLIRKRMEHYAIELVMTDNYNQGGKLGSLLFNSSKDNQRTNR